ncbi:MAG TPA: tetratricopeptide repeat protein [Pyrinomonadaceae bacterium]|jgi:tetratricopeptide (TPR) repeat protein
MRVKGGRLRITCALFLLLLISVSASAKETWTRVQSRNFVLVGNGSDRDLRKVAMRLEEFRKAITLLLPRASINASVPTTVMVFKNDSSFDPFKPRYKGKAQNNVAGIFLRGTESNYIAMTTETGGLVSPYHVIFHEFVHFLVGNNLANAPLWLNEGLAEFYSTFETADDDQKVVIGRPIVWHLEALQQARHLPLKTLLAVDRKSPHYNESSKAGVFYAQSWALTHYLMLGNGGKRQEQLARFIDRLRSMSQEENFRVSFGVTYEQMETELYNYLHKTSYPMVEFKLRQQLDFDKEVQSATLSEAEVKYYQGELYTRLRRFDEAESSLQKAIELDGKLAAPKLSLGILRYLQARSAEAKVFLERAIENDPQNYLAHNYYALVLAAEGKTDDAIKAFKTAIELNPKAVKIYIQLAALYARLGRYDEAIDSYNRATKVDFYETQAYRDALICFYSWGRAAWRLPTLARL